MSARASARTLSARAWFSAVRDRYSHGASTMPSPARARVVMASTSGSWSIWLCCAITMPNAAPTRPSPDDDPDQGRPATAGDEGRQPDLAAGLGAPAPLMRAVGLTPDQGGAGAGERDRPEQLGADAQPAALDDPQQPGAERGEGQQHAPVDPAPRSGRVAHARPGWPTPGRARGHPLRRQQQPERAVREHPDELERHQRHERDPDHQHRPAEVPGQAVLTPPSQAPSATRVARAAARAWGRPAAVVWPSGLRPRRRVDRGRRQDRLARRLDATRVGGGHNVLTLTRPSVDS